MARISSVRRHTTNFGNGCDLRHVRLSDQAAIGKQSYEISLGGELTSGKQRPPILQLVLWALMGSWIFIA